VHDSLPRGVLIFGDLESGRVRDVSWLDGSMLEDFSADGGRILFSEGVHGQSSGGGDVFVRRNDGSPAILLGEGEALTLSPDGEWVATLSGEKPKKLVLLPTGAGEAKTVPLGDIEAVDATFVPGSRRLAVFGTKAGAGRRIYLMDWEGRNVQILGPEDPGGPTFSPDGKRAVIRSAKAGRQIWSLDGGAPPTDLPGIGPNELVIQWSKDGRFLILRSLFVLPVELSRYEIATGRRTALQKLEPVDLAGVMGLQRVLVSRDGRYYAYSYWTKTKSDLYVIDGLQARLW